MWGIFIGFFLECGVGEICLGVLNMWVYFDYIFEFVMGYREYVIFLSDGGYVYFFYS